MLLFFIIRLNLSNFYITRYSLGCNVLNINFVLFVLFVYFLLILSYFLGYHVTVNKVV